MRAQIVKAEKFGGTDWVSHPETRYLARLAIRLTD